MGIENSKMINVRLDRELYLKLLNYSEFSNKNISQIIREYLEKIVEKNLNIDEILRYEEIEKIIDLIGERVKKKSKGEII